MKIEKLKKISGVIEKILLIIFYMCFLIILIDDISDFIKNGELEEVGSWIFIGVVFLYALLASLKNNSNLILFLIATYFIAILLNFLTPLKISDIPMTNLMLIVIIYSVMFVKSLKVIKRNTFLKIMISAAAFFVLVYSVNLSILILANFGTDFDKYLNPLFIIVTLSIIFGLPNSNFPDWIKEHRVIFTTSVISIWILLFFISTSKFFISDHEYLRNLIFGDNNKEWFMKDYSIEEKPGMAD
jgi:hypothetical protein